MHQQQKLSLQSFGMKRHYSVKLLLQEGYLATWISSKNLNARSHLVHLKRNISELSLLHDCARPHSGGRTTEAITKFGWTASALSPRGCDVAPICLETTSKDTITGIARHCRAPCASSCRGRRETCTGRTHTVLFQGGRQMLTEMKTVIKIAVLSTVM